MTNKDTTLVRDITSRKSQVKSDEEETAMLVELFEEYRSAYVPEWDRLAKCDRLYRCEHWDDYPAQSANEPMPVTPVIQSTVENVMAELSEYYPEAVIVADNPKYENAAKLLSAVIRENHIACNYEQEFHELLYDLLVGGYCVQEIGYDREQNGGLGGAYIRHVDNRNIMFDPTAVCIEDCRAIFKFEAHNYSWFRMHYPEKVNLMNFDEHLLKNTADNVLRPAHDEKALLIECWLREYDTDTDTYRIHMIKIGGGVKLEDSRDLYPCGYYEHGRYPFTITKLFTRKGSCLGYGYADMFEKQQVLSDKLDQIIIKNALMASHNKMLVSSASGFDVNDLRDWSKEVHKGENINGIKWFSTAPLPSYIPEYAERMRQSVRDESGANDFSRGNTTGGVIAASAIAALIEESTKRARNIAKRLHNAYAEAVRTEIETERQFAFYTRMINADDGERLSFSGLDMADDDMPIEFKVTVKVQRENRFSVLAHNETILNLVDRGMLSPDVGLSMLVFDGRDEALQKMKQKVQENAGRNKTAIEV